MTLSADGRSTSDCMSFPEEVTHDVTARVTRIGRAKPPSKEGESWTIIAGLSLESIRQRLRNAVAVAQEGRGGEVRYLGEIDTTEAATRKLVTKLAAKYGQLTFCCEAGRTGYGLYRLIRSLATTASWWPPR